MIDPNTMMGMVSMRGGPPSADPAMMAPPPVPDENMILGMLMDAVTGRWSGQEAQISGERDVLIQTLMMLANVGAPMGGMDMVEPGLGGPMAEEEFVEG